MKQKSLMRLISIKLTVCDMVTANLKIKVSWRPFKTIHECMKSAKTAERAILNEFELSGIFGGEHQINAIF